MLWKLLLWKRKDLPQKAKEVLEREAADEWNPRGKTPVHQWLEATCPSAERMKTLGNVVMPRQCQFALQVLKRSRAAP